jgi:hypothetical protein
LAAARMPQAAADWQVRWAIQARQASQGRETG